MSLPVISDEIFTFEHLFESPENAVIVQDFTVKNPSGKNLVRFLKEIAPYNESVNADRTYLVKDKTSYDVAGYFALRNGLFTLKNTGGKTVSIPSIELSNFAVNETYRLKHPELSRIGEMIFKHFILPLAKHIQSLTGAQALYIYALPEDRLVSHYASFGFSRLNKEDEEFVYDTVKPAYDADCIFMYQIL